MASAEELIQAYNHYSGLDRMSRMAPEGPERVEIARGALEARAIFLLMNWVHAIRAFAPEVDSLVEAARLGEIRVNSILDALRNKAGGHPDGVFIPGSVKVDK